MIKRTLIASALAVAALPAAAQTTTGLYVGLGAGGVMLTESINTRNPPAIFGQGNGHRFTFNTGANVLASIGYGLGNGVRLELEGTWRSSRIAGAQFFQQGSFNGGVGSTGGSIQSYGFMANALYDVDLTVLGPNWRWIQPYFGAGLGLALTNVRDIGFNLSPSLSTTATGSGRNLAWQIIAGAAFPLDNVLPGLSATVEYRYWQALPPNLRLETRTIPTNAGEQPFLLTQFTRSFSPQVGGHNLNIGLRYAFNQPSGVAAAASGPLGFTMPNFARPAAAMQNFAVFFPLNNANLDAQARGTVAQAVQAARAGGASSLDVVGQADGAPNANNRGLASRRAQAVTAALVAQGIPRSAINVSTVGGTGPQDPTSRRVDITLR